MKMLGIWIHDSACHITDLYVFMCLDFGERLMCEFQLFRVSEL